MIANENQYRVTQERARQFARLVARMKSGDAQSIPGELPAIRQGKLDAAKSVLQDLQQELEDWEAMRPKPTADQAANASDAARVAIAIAGIFVDADAGRRANRLRTLFAETLDFEPAHGVIPLPVHHNLPADARHIADYDGVAAAYIALPDPTRTRINKSDAATAARAVADRLGADPLLVFSNGPNDRLEFVRPIPAGGDRTELRRIVISRDLPQRTAPELLADIYARTQETGSIHEALHQIFAADTSAREVIPTNPTDIFTPHLEPLRRLYSGLQDEPATQTKRELWLDMLRGSGCAPADPDEATDLFISHTLLVTIARAVIATMSDWERPEDPASVMAEGFASWPQNRDERGPTHKPGVDWTRAVFHTANTYDWRPRTRDVLRNIYQELIPAAQRKAFGEYYTPDWLAGMLADRIIDDAWLERAVARYLHSGDAPAGVGILDPACGSGTFLYYAALRIRDSAALRQAGATPTEQADFIARMVNGIDIHPIAAEISRATLMRALPAEPAAGSEALQIYQGDSLIYTHRGMELANTAGLPYHTLESRAGRYLQIPTQWAARPGFGAKVQRFVAAANLGQPLPADTLDGLLESDRQTLARTYETLREVIREEGNSVWAWYIFNSVSPAALKERKVDRILANPPWVRMSNIQVASRKRELEQLIGNMNLWPGGKANTGFDIGGLFVIRCREMYLRNDADNRVAWVLNSTAIKGSNWQRVREQSQDWNAEFLDFGELKDAPFTGAKSCALIQGTAPAGGPAQTRMINKDGRRVRRADDAATAQANSEIVAKPAGFPAERSDYFTGGKPDFRMGATLVPHSLVRIAAIIGKDGANVSFTTANSSHRGWPQFNATQGEVPEHYISNVAFSDDLLSFVTRDELTKVIIPLDPDGNLDGNRDAVDYWHWAESCYQANRGLGTSTPKTLWGNLDSLGKLRRQLDDRAGKQGLTKVIYNTAGQHLRASRTALDALAESGLYHAAFGTEDEASYLTAILNADCLQLAYQGSRKSDKHFHHHIWRAVPIPRYDGGNGRHRELASLCGVAEQAAAGVRDRLPSDTGQIKLCEAIRRELRANGISGLIDEQARAILPRHSTPAA